MPNIILKHSAGGVIVHQNKVLAITWTNKNFICFPKGGLEHGESSKEAAMREVKEETGYNTEIICALGSWTYQFEEEKNKYQKTVDYYLMGLLDNNKPTPSRGANEDFTNIWLDIATAEKYLTYGDAKEAFLKAKEYTLQKSQL